MREVSDDREPQQPSQPQQPPGSTLLPLAPPPPPPPPSSAAPPRIPTTIGEALLQSIGAWGQGGPARGDGGDDDDEAVVIHAREEDGRFECPICTKSFSTQKTTRKHMQREHPGMRCHVLKRRGMTVGLVGQAKVEHIRRLNREANRRYQARRRAQKGANVANQQHLPVPSPPLPLLPPGIAATTAAAAPPPSPSTPSLETAITAAGPRAAGAEERSGGMMMMEGANETGQGGGGEEARRRSSMSPRGGGGVGGEVGVAAQRAAFGDLLGLEMQEPSEEEQGETSPARDNSQRCLEAFILLWSKEPGVYAAVEAHLREHPLPGPPDGMEPPDRRRHVASFLDAVAPALPPPPPPPPQPAAPPSPPLEEQEEEEEEEGEEQGGAVFSFSIPPPPLIVSYAAGDDEGERGILLPPADGAGLL